MNPHYYTKKSTHATCSFNKYMMHSHVIDAIKIITNVRKNNKHLICISIIGALCISVTPEARAMSDGSKHFAASAAFGAGSETLLTYTTEMRTASKLFFGTVLGVLPGLLKETMDSTEQDNSFSGGDMQSDILGSLGGASLSCLFNNFVHISLDSNDNNMVKVSLKWKF